MEIHIREFNASDKGFVYSAWLRGLFYGCPLYREMQKEAFFEAYPKVLDKILLNPSNRLVVATLPDDHDILLGFACVGPGAIHWVYTKAAWRKQGIAKKLLDGQHFQVCTHLSDEGIPLARKLKIKYNPFII